MSVQADYLIPIDFGLSEERKMMIDMLKKFKEKECPKEKIGEWDEANHFPVDVWKKLGNEGILGACFPEEYGGTGGNIVDETLITEEISNSFSAMGLAYLTGVCFGGMSILHYGTDEQKNNYLPKLIAGDWNFALSLTEPGGGTDILGALKSRAVEQPDGSYIANGNKIFTTGLHAANTIVFIARTDDVEGKPARGLSMFLIDRDNPGQQEIDGDLLKQQFCDGLSYNKIKKLGSHILASFEVAYEDVKISKEALLGERGKGWYSLVSTLNNERIVCAAICVGLAQGCLEEANQYAIEREAFGKPIGQFQAIQHQLADMATEIELSRLITYKAAWMQANNPTDPSVGVIASMAKMYTSDAAFRCTDRAMRILAGYGFTMEYHIQRYYRDIRQLVFAPITNEMSRSFIGQVMLGQKKSY
ncbi:MAG: acyl-CoA/acyl-ACP dehydrogenase [Deltaproteobacteria bacterium]|nr:acyl-CoA/acyl-ACP dehydrogenase [Deltaproteobacteria bacterium]